MKRIRFVSDVVKLDSIDHKICQNLESGVATSQLSRYFSCTLLDVTLVHEILRPSTYRSDKDIGHLIIGSFPKLHFSFGHLRDTVLEALLSHYDEAYTGLMLGSSCVFVGLGVFAIEGTNQRMKLRGS